MGIEKCAKCINSRSIVSENGVHYNCCLSVKKALECLRSGCSKYFLTFNESGELTYKEDGEEDEQRNIEISF